ncbi:MAG TPA: 3-hydroxybutyryl-CoA dehydrogenase [Acidimicrobiales bacterium]|nr:3-hydroxybutyryl-CoA dehydrogenase [Acidimicrobiales bacterium]
MEFERVGVVGSGIMASGIAEVAAGSGASVMLRARNAAGAADLDARLDESLARAVERGKRTAEEAAALRARITTTTELGDLAHCDLVIESVVEDLEVKLDLFRALGRVAAEGAVIATGTSTLPVIDLAMQVPHPERVLGIHFFNPAPQMSLVEVVRPLSVSEAVVGRAVAFVRECGKDPIEVKDQAGFIVNALLFPYLNNAVRLLERGVATKEGIDAAMKGGCGFPMGPFALLDLVGLDTSIAILEALYAEYGDPNYSPEPLLRRMVSAGRLGRKSGSGFYPYR